MWCIQTLGGCDNPAEELARQVEDGRLGPHLSLSAPDGVGWSPFHCLFTDIIVMALFTKHYKECEILSYLFDFGQITPLCVTLIMCVPARAWLGRVFMTLTAHYIHYSPWSLAARWNLFYYCIGHALWHVLTTVLASWWLTWQFVHSDHSVGCIVSCWGITLILTIFSKYEFDN